MLQSNSKPISWLQAIIILAGLAPLTYIPFTSLSPLMDPESIQSIQRWTGNWALNMLLLTLSISPLRALTQQHWLIRLRRSFGLLCFFWACLHLLGFTYLEHEFALSSMADDVLKRPFILIGLATFALLLPLAATSNQWALRKLGGKAWQTLHRNIYLIGILACLHYLWQAKLATLLWPLGYTLVLVLLLGWRVRTWRHKAIPVGYRDKAKPLRFFKRKPD